MDVLQLEKCSPQQARSLNMLPANQKAQSLNTNVQSSYKQPLIKPEVQILYQINHQADHQIKHQTQLSDFICLKDQYPNNFTKRSLSSQEKQTFKNLSPKRSLFLFVQCQKDLPDCSLSSSRPAFHQIITFLQNLNRDFTNPLDPCSILYPFSTKYQSVSTSEAFFLQININHIPLPFSSLQTLLPIQLTNWNVKTQSEMFCLNKFYRFLLTVAKSLQKVIEQILTQFKINVEEISDFFMKVLVKQNIYHQNKSGAFYLLLIPNRAKSTDQKLLSPSKSMIRCQKVNCNNQLSLSNCYKNIMKKCSKIFWQIFFPNNQSKKRQSGLHTSFLQNFLASAIKGELDLDEALQILESKQKRKSFINQKISLSAKKTQKDLRQISINESNFINQDQIQRRLHISRYQMGQIRSYEMSDLNLFNDKLNKKTKSVHRKLTGKRNTIDVIIQQSAQKNFPPCFQSRSQQKKTRLFKHDLGYKKREKNSLGSHSRQKNYQTINNSVNYNNPQNGKVGKNVIKNDNTNLYENFSFIGSMEINSDKRKASKTIEVGEIRGRNNHQYVERLYMQNEQNWYGNSRVKLANFLKSNLNSNDFMRKSSTHNIQSLVKADRPQTKINPYSKTLTTTNQVILNMERRQSVAISKNRRYYHINNFVSGTNNQSIQNLILTQKRLIQKQPQHSRSMQKDLLNRSQEKAFAIFNSQIRSKQLETQNSQNLEYQSKTLTKDQNQGHINATNNKVSDYLHKKGSQQLSGHEENSLPKRLHVKQSYGNKKGPQNHLSAFSPPKKHKSTHGIGNRQMSPEFSDFTDKKIDDRQFRHKFSLHINRNTVSSQDQLIVHNRELTRQYHKQQPILNLKQVKQVTNHVQSFKGIIPLKINNEYLTSQDGELLGRQEPIKQIKPDQKALKSMDRTEKSLINAGKKLSQKLKNKNFNIEQVFAEQEMLTQQQHQIRQLLSPVQKTKQQPKRKYSEGQQKASLNEKNDQEKQQVVRKFSTNSKNLQVTLGNDQIRYKGRESSSTSQDRMAHQQMSELQYEVNQKQLKQTLEELTELISPIRHASKDQIKKEKVDKIIEQHSIADPQYSQETSPLLKPKPIVNLKYTQELTSFNQILDKQTKNDKVGVQYENKQSPQLINDQAPHKYPANNNPPQSIESLQHAKIEQAVVLQKKPILTNRKPTQTQPLLANKSKPNSSSHQLLNTIKQPKQIPQKPKITQEQQFELQQIKFTPSKSKPLSNPNFNLNPSTKPLIQNQTQSKHLPSTISKPPVANEPNNKPPQQKFQHQTKPSQQQALLSPANSARKNNKEPKRQATTESVASSFGPHKTVKKIVEQYVFMVNKIGQAVAKTPKIAKKVETVTDWYVGAYFLYKRFLYERKKMEKYLKEGTPKLTRYDEEINLDDWKAYLKSPERHTLMTKVSEENVNIAKSIQKMQARLLAKNVPDSIKQHAAISQRTSRETVIAVDAVIDEFDTLVQKGMLNDDDILAHCTEMLNACLIIAELDQLVEDIVPVSEFSKSKRTAEQLEVIAQDLYDLYHDE